MINDSKCHSKRSLLSHLMRPHDPFSARCPSRSYIFSSLYVIVIISSDRSDTVDSFHVASMVHVTSAQLAFLSRYQADASSPTLSRETTMTACILTIENKQATFLPSAFRTKKQLVLLDEETADHTPRVSRADQDLFQQDLFVMGRIAGC